MTITRTFNLNKPSFSGFWVLTITKLILLGLILLVVPVNHTRELIVILSWCVFVFAVILMLGTRQMYVFLYLIAMFSVFAMHSTLQQNLTQFNYWELLNPLSAIYDTNVVRVMGLTSILQSSFFVLMTVRGYRDYRVLEHYFASIENRLRYGRIKVLTVCILVGWGSVLAAYPFGVNILTGARYNMILQSSNRGWPLLVVFSTAFALISSRKSGRRYLISVFHTFLLMGYMLLKGARVEPLGVFLLLGYLYLTQSGFFIKGWTYKKLLLFIFSVVSLILLYAIYMFIGDIRTGSTFEIINLIQNKSIGDFLYTLYASIDQASRNGLAYFDVFRPYIVRTVPSVLRDSVGLNAEYLLVSLKGTGGGLYYMGEVYAAFGIIGVFLANIIIIGAVLYVTQQSFRKGFLREVFVLTSLLFFPRIVFYSFVFLYKPLLVGMGLYFGLTCLTKHYIISRKFVLSFIGEE